MARGTGFPAPGSAPMRQAPRPVSRPHPIRRLIDGRPDDPGRRIARRTTLLMIPAIVGANFTGAVVVFTLIAFVLPLPDVEDEDVAAGRQPGRSRRLRARRLHHRDGVGTRALARHP